MKTIDIRIEGITAMLCNRFTDKAQIAATNSTRGSIVGEQLSPREEATTRLYTNGDGVPVIPQPNLLKCIMEGGRYFKAGR